MQRVLLAPALEFFEDQRHREEQMAKRFKALLEETNCAAQFRYKPVLTPDGVLVQAELYFVALEEQGEDGA